MKLRLFLALVATLLCTSAKVMSQDPKCVLVRDFRTVKDNEVVNFNIGTAAHGPSTLATLKKCWPHTRFCIWADAPLAPELQRMMARRFPDVPIYVGKEIPDKEADLLLVSSGSGIAGSVRESIRLWREQTQKPVAAYAIGFNSSIKKLTKGFAFCYIRDSLALADAQACQALPACHGFAPDAVFNFDCTDEAEANQLMDRLGLKAGQFVCAIPGYRFTQGWEFFGPSQFNEKNARHNEAYMMKDNAIVCAAICTAVREYGMKVLLCAETRPEIGLAHKAVLPQLPDDVRAQCVVLDQFWSPDLALGIYKKSRAVFGIQMHSQVMALGNGVPACVFRHQGFGTKSTMLRNVGAGQWLLDIDDPKAREKAIGMMHDILANPKATARKCKAIRRNIDKADRKVAKAIRKVKFQ